MQHLERPNPTKSSSLTFLRSNIAQNLVDRVTMLVSYQT
jgi:hypothetical protein